MFDSFGAPISYLQLGQLTSDVDIELGEQTPTECIKVLAFDQLILQVFFSACNAGVLAVAFRRLVGQCVRPANGTPAANAWIRGRRL